MRRRWALGLFLLGLGWSFGLVAGSTLLSESVPAAVRPGVQGASDFVMSASGALGGVLAGVVVGTLGYLHLNVLACLVVVPVVVLALRAAPRWPGRLAAGRRARPGRLSDRPRRGLPSGSVLRLQCASGLVH